MSGKLIVVPHSGCPIMPTIAVLRGRAERRGGGRCPGLAESDCYWSVLDFGYANTRFGASRPGRLVGPAGRTRRASRTGMVSAAQGSAFAICNHVCAHRLSFRLDDRGAVVGHCRADHAP